MICVSLNIDQHFQPVGHLKIQDGSTSQVSEHRASLRVSLLTPAQCQHGRNIDNAINAINRQTYGYRGQKRLLVKVRKSPPAFHN